MDLNKLAAKHQNSRMNKKHFKDFEKFIGGIQAIIDSKLENEKRKYRNTVLTLDVDTRNTEKHKQTTRHNAEVNVLAIHELISILQDGIDTAKQAISQAKALHINSEDY